MSPLQAQETPELRPQPTGPGSPRGKVPGWAKQAIVGAVCLFSAVMAFGTLSGGVLDSHECMVSVAAREMVASGNYVLPTINGVPRLKKPPLSYWLVAGLSRLTGRCDELAARLPSAIAGFLSAMAVLYFVSHWTSLRTGLLCTSLWATSIGFIEWSHNARAEMLMTFFCTLCLLLFFDLQRFGSRRRQWGLAALFWLSFGLANLAKGPIPFPVVFLPIIAYALLRRKWRMIGRLHIPLGLLLTLAIALPWPIMIAAQLNWDLTLWKNEIFSRFGGEYATRGRPLYYYLPIMFKHAAPWVVVLPIGLLSPFYRIWGRRRPLMIYLGLWFFIGLLFFTVSGGKRPHYILPQMPAAAILMGIVLDDLAFGGKAFSRLFTRRVLAVHAIALAVAVTACAGFVVMKRQELTNAIVVAGIGSAVLIGVAGYFVRSSSRLRHLTVPLFIVGFGTTCLFGLSIHDRLFDDYRPTMDFALKVRDLVPADEELFVYGDLPNTFLHYYGRPVPVVKEPEAVRSHYLQGHWVIVLSSDLPDECRRQGCQIVFARDKQSQRRHDIYGYLLHAGASDRSS